MLSSLVVVVQRNTPGYCPLGSPKGKKSPRCNIKLWTTRAEGDHPAVTTLYVHTFLAECLSAEELGREGKTNNLRASEEHI